MHLLLQRPRARLAAGALVSLLLLAGVTPHAAGPAITDAVDHLSVPQAAGPVPRALAASPKPDWRVDPANTGDTGFTGPVITPTAVFNVKTVLSGSIGGIELDSAGNLIFNVSTNGTVYSYNPATGAKNWQFAGQTATTMGQDAEGPPSNPSVSSDGSVYVGNDRGELYQINATTGVGSVIFSVTGSKALQGTPKIGPDNTIYVGASDGVFYHLAPPVPGSGQQATVLYSFAATGSTQPSDAIYPGASQSPFRFYGEAALDRAGNAYVASSDANPVSSSFARVGTVYRLRPDGTLAWAAPLSGEAVGAILLAPNPSNPAQMLVISANRNAEVVALDAATGAQVWSYQPTDTVSSFVASPALSRDGTTVYVVNHGDTLYALNVATGQPVAGFGPSGDGTLPIPGSDSSLVVDAQGDIYLGSNSGALYGFSATGAPLFVVPGGTATGQSGNIGNKYMSLALDANATLYTGGINAIVRGFTPLTSDQQTQVAGRQQTQTAIAAPTVTALAQQTAVAATVAAATNQAVQTLIAIGNQTQTAQEAQTATQGPRDTASAVAQGGTPTASRTDQPTPTATIGGPSPTATTATSGNAPSPTATTTPGASQPTATTPSSAVAPSATPPSAAPSSPSATSPVTSAVGTALGATATRVATSTGATPTHIVTLPTRTRTSVSRPSKPAPLSHVRADKPATVTWGSAISVSGQAQPNSFVSITARLTVTKIASKKIVVYVRVPTPTAHKPRPHAGKPPTPVPCRRGVKGCVPRTVVRRVTSTTTLYAATAQPRADRRGAFKAKLTFKYKTRYTTMAVLTVSLSSVRGSYSRSSPVKITPPSAHKRTSTAKPKGKSSAGGNSKPGRPPAQKGTPSKKR